MFGRIHWRVGSKAFPSKDWDDFVVVILSWWMAEMRSHLRSGTRRRLLFMDGPYFVELSTVSTSVGELKFCRDGLRGADVLAVQQVRKAALRRSLMTAAESTLAKCRRMSASSPDIDKLEREFKKLSIA